MTQFSTLDAYVNAKDWLKFAEAKNAAAVALSAIMLPLHVSAISSDNVLSKLYGWSCLPMLCLGLLLALLSFLPRLTKIPYMEAVPSYGAKSKENSDLSLVYFDHIHRLETEDFLVKFQHQGTGDKLDGFDKDLISQVHSIAGVTARKMKLFAWSLRLIICGILTPAAALLLIIIWKNDD